VGLAKELQALTADILPALEELPVIAYLLDDALASRGAGTRAAPAFDL